MRTIKELLILLREYFPKSDICERGALCFAIRDMYHDHHLISREEEHILYDYIHDNRHKCLGIKRACSSDFPYFFPDGELAPRLKFLDKLIAEL